MSRFSQPKRRRAFRVRCRRCEHRTYMSAHPETYSRGLACTSCGHHERDRAAGWRVDWYRTSGQENRDRGVCGCMAAPFPHRPGHGLSLGGGCSA